MEHEELPAATMRAIGTLVIAVYDIARVGLHDVVERLRPLLEPPDDLRVGSANGGQYSGVIIIERNTVVAGFVVEVGRLTHTREPIVTPPPRPVYERPRSPLSGITDHFSRNDGRLPSWADESRLDPEEDEPWRRR